MRVPGNSVEAFSRVVRKLRVVFENRRASDALDVINCCRQPDRAGNVRRASLESVRRFLKRALFERDAYDHFASALPRRHRIEKLRASVKHADASRSTHFVSGERKEIAAQFLHIERHVPDALRRVHQA